MKKVLLIGLLVVISFANTIAQNNLPPAYEIKTDKAVDVTLDDAYWQILEDTAGKLTIEQVSQSPLAEKFHPNNTNKKGINHSIRAYWVRYRFKNGMTHEAKITIPKNITYADLHARNAEGKWDHKKNRNRGSLEQTGRPETHQSHFLFYTNWRGIIDIRTE